LLKLINLACGQTFHSNWINLDQCASSEEVRFHDLRTPLPFPDDYADAIYCSHFLEHLDESQGRVFLQECHRCLNNKGVLRIVVPDFERLAQDYLNVVRQLHENANVETEHQWMHLEIFDQFSRKRPEGEMGTFLNNPENHKNFFIRNRVGLSIDNFRNKNESVKKSESQSIAIGFFRSLKKFFFDSAYRTHLLMKKLCPKNFKIFSIYPSDSFLNEIILMFFSSLTYKEMKEATFRNSGEVHQQSYDQFKLKRLLLDIGFCEASKKRAEESSIKNWTSYGLDTTPEGFEKKADSLYMEAFKSLQS
jgi:predicted SAM-dependent methyltransferase